jgi:hypothetical protein
MPAKLNLESKDNGRYRTGGLDSKQFLQAFKRIQKENAKSRSNRGKRSLTREQLKRKSKADLVKLGRKEDGTAFTKEDLDALEKNKEAFERKYDKNTSGISFQEIMAGSTPIDIKRANNQVSDGSGITSGHIVAVKGNSVAFRVKASAKNGDDDHMAQLRFEEWDDYIEDADVSTKGYQKAAKEAVKGRISIACDCGRHQYWYRYLATIGNYCIAPPKEYSSPKIRNPNLKGVACKHVLFVANKLQSPTWANLLATHMKSQAKKTGYTDTKKVLSEDDIKQQKKSRKGKINEDNIQAEFKKYQKRQAALAKKMASSKTEIDKLRKGMKARESTIDKQRKALAKEKKEKGDLVRFSFPMFKDANTKKNWSNDQLRKEFAKQSGINIKVVEGVLNDS